MRGLHDNSISCGRPAHEIDMGGAISRSSVKKARHVIWCDTEGGVRGVNLWDITCIEETSNSVRVQRFCSVSDATKRGRARLRQDLPALVYRDSTRSKSTCVARHELRDGAWTALDHTNVAIPLKTLLVSYLESRAGCVLVAWNMRGHDRHVLTRAVGEETLDKLALWDALAWFRSVYRLPKNTMSSNKAGTPRALFNVPVHGNAHSSFSDAAHMRDVVMRAAYCIRREGKVDTSAYKSSTRSEQFESACAEIEKCIAVDEWHDVVDRPWAEGTIPKAIYSAPDA